MASSFRSDRSFAIEVAMARESKHSSGAGQRFYLSNTTPDSARQRSRESSLREPKLDTTIGIRLGGGFYVQIGDTDLSRPLWG